MKTYTGTKIVNAEIMTRGEYNRFRGWELPANEDGSDIGYLVEYTDGGKANTSAYAGYVSWSPADVFERAYRPVPQPHQQRVIEEKAELDKKCEALRDFLDTDRSMGIDPVERARLARQLTAMAYYADILRERIEAF